MQSKMSDDVRFVYKDKQWAFFLSVLETACLRAGFSDAKTAKVMNLRSELVTGFHTDRDVSPTGFWDEWDEIITSEQAAEDEAARKLRCDNFFRSAGKVPRDTWADPEEIKEMQRQKDAMVASKKWVAVQETKSPPAVCFPVRQKSKIRLCIDLRQHNACIKVREKMRLLGSRATAEIITRLASDKATPVTLFQCKRDVTADIAAERDLVKNLASAAAASAENARDFGSSPAEDVCGKHGDPDFAASFIPVNETKDAEGYYYNFAVAAKELNSFLVPRLTADEAEAFERGRTPRKVEVVRQWDKIESLVTVFGSLISVYKDVGVSEGLMLCLVVVLRKLAPVYIDDINLMDRRKSAPSSSALVDLFLALCGFPQQMTKQDRNYSLPQDEVVRRSAIALGLAYTRSKDEDSMVVSVPAEKIGRLVESLQGVLSTIQAGKLKRADLETARGLFRYCAQLSTGAAGIAKSLDPWCADAFGRRIKCAKLRRQLKAAVIMLLHRARTFQSKTIKKGFPAVVRHLYGDAALGDWSKARPAGRRGWVDVSGCDIFIGALLVSQDSRSATGFTHQLLEVPAWLANLKPDIAFFESVCAHVAQKFFAAALCDPPSMCIHHIDNTAECYGIVKGSSHSIATQIVLMALHEDVADREIYWAWIASARNLSDPLTRLEKIDMLQSVLPTTIVDVGCGVFEWNRYCEVLSSLTKIGRVQHACERAERVQRKKRKIDAVRSSDRPSAPAPGEGNSTTCS
eukprot:g6143.t1